MFGKKLILEGKNYFPSKKVIAQTNLKDWEKIAELARNDLQRS